MFITIILIMYYLQQVKYSNVLIDNNMSIKIVKVAVKKKRKTPDFSIL